LFLVYQIVEISKKRNKNLGLKTNQYIQYSNPADSLDVTSFHHYYLLKLKTKK